MMPYRSASFELDTAIISRILSLNPAIYEDIQFGNPYVAPMLERLVGQLQALQVQQQLATQSLSIANQAPQALLSLFRG